MVPRLPVSPASPAEEALLAGLAELMGLALWARFALLAGPVGPATFAPPVGAGRTPADEAAEPAPPGNACLRDQPVLPFETVRTERQTSPFRPETYGCQHRFGWIHSVRQRFQPHLNAAELQSARRRRS